MGSLPLSLSSVQGFAYKGQLRRGLWSTCIQRFLDLTKCCFAFRSSSVMLYCLTDCLFVFLLPCAKWLSSWLCIQLVSRLIPAFLSPSQHFPSLNSLHVHVGVFFLHVMFTVIKLSIKSVPRETSLIICKTLYIPGFFNLVPIPRVSTRDRKKTDTGNEVQLDIWRATSLTFIAKRFSCCSQVETMSSESSRETKRFFSQDRD